MSAEDIARTPDARPIRATFRDISPLCELSEARQKEVDRIVSTPPGRLATHRELKDVLDEITAGLRDQPIPQR